MKILWHGVKPNIKTGYGGQSRLFIPALKSKGHDVAISCISDQYTMGASGGVTYYPTGPIHAQVGNHLFHGHIRHFKPDIVLSMIDAFCCYPDKFAPVNWFPWVMVDSEPLSPLNYDILQVCRRPIAPTAHAMQVLKTAGLDPIYVPLAIDTKIYHVTDKGKARDVLAKTIDVDLDGKFVCVMTAANHSLPSRKNFHAAFKAWKMLNDVVPDALLYVHTEVTGGVYPGEDLRVVADMIGAKNIYYAPQYEYNAGLVSDDFLNSVYNAADVYLCTSRGEGFGLPIVEAQATGCRVVAPLFGAMGELTLHGSRVEKGMMFMPYAGTEQFLVDPEETARCLQIEYDFSLQMTDERRQKISEAVAHFDIHEVMQRYMVPALEIMERHIADQTSEDHERIQEKAEAMRDSCRP